MRRNNLILVAMAFVLAICAATAMPQNSRTLYFSNQYRSDAAAMPQTDAFTLDDPVYLVLNLSKTQNTVADLTSVDPETGKRNFWFCFSPEPADQNFNGVKPKCIGILPEPISGESLNAKAFAFKILPSGKELAGNKTDLSEGVISLIAARRTLGPVEVPFTYYIYGKADRALKAGKVVISAQNWDQSETGKYLKSINTKADNDALAGRKTIVTNWVKGLTSKRNDPALEKAIKSSDPAPIIHIVFLQPGYDIIRNELGIVLRKAIMTLYVYKWVKTGKCYAHWQYYGYESLGGGAFNSDLGSWRVDTTNNGWHIAELKVPGTYGFPSGENWEVDCAVFGG